MNTTQYIDEAAFDPSGKRILFISAHPDDADFSAAGTAVKWLSQGATGAIVIATNGNKGTEDKNLTSDELAKLRHREQLAAGEVLGLEHTWFLDYPDAHLEVSQELKESLVQIIRTYKPDVVFTFDPSMLYSISRGFINHPDHRAIGQAALDAVFPMARDFLTFPQHHQAGIKPHKVTDLFLYNFDGANFFVDITDTMEEKIRVLQAHESQFDLEKDGARVREWNTKSGEKIGVTYAERFLYLHID